MRMEEGVSKNEPSKTRRSFLPTLKIRPCGTRHVSEKKRSSQHESSTACFLCSSLISVFSTLVRFLETEGRLP